MSTATSTVRVVSESAMPAGVRVSQLQPALGSIISGFKFDGRPLKEEFRSALRDLLHNRGLVIFEPGTVTAENFTVLAGFLGEFFNYAGPHTPRAPENPDATMIDSLKDKNLRNHIWHADGGFRPDVPAFTALYAHEHGFPVMTSSLGLSRWKNMAQINDCGHRAAGRYDGLSYWDFNWRKGGGSQRMIEISKREEFYQQEYCGCVYSLRDTNLHRRSQGREPITLGTQFYRESDGDS